MNLQIGNRTARRVVLNLQGLQRECNLPLSDASLRAIIREIGFVQIDSIRWVDRAQHMILHARNSNYRPQRLPKLIESRRWLFENYTHDASVIPCEFFRYWKHKFARTKDRLQTQYSKWQGPGFLKQCQPVLDHISKNGAVRSRDLSTQAMQKPKAMWQWNDAKTALEFLWRTGMLGISAREGFERVYDLVERTIPAKQFEAQCDDSEFIDWACRDALMRLGFGSASDIAGFWECVTVAEVRGWLKANTDAWQIVSVQQTDGSRIEVPARADIEAVIDACQKLPNRLRTLSPFDPVCRDRKRLEKLFGFDYRIEIYVPAKKRKYGYYVFPMLDGETFVGRIDMKADRNADCLAVTKVWWEEAAGVSKALQKRMLSELNRQAKFAGVSEVQLPA